MSENQDEKQGQVILPAKDFVDVVDEDGNSLGYQVPKHWGAEQLAPGTKKKSGRVSSSSSTPAPDPDAEPKANASRADWATYAQKVKSATAEDLVVDGKDLTRDELAAKYGTPAE